MGYQEFCAMDGARGGRGTETRESDFDAEARRRGEKRGERKNQNEGRSRIHAFVGERRERRKRRDGPSCARMDRPGGLSYWVSGERAKNG
jgi:hypothetical protein